MSWTLYRVTWRLESPLHSGFAKLGNIQRTRMYVTGQMLWGALTARLTRDQGSQDYQAVGVAVNDWLVFSYGFISVTADGGQPLLPKFSAAGVQFGVGDHTLSERAAQRLCLSSYAATALDYTANTAVDGSLHEVEFISPRALGAETALGIRAGQALYLTAMIAADAADQANSDERVKGWRAALERLAIGGERSYGFGRLRLMQISEPIAGADLSTAWFGNEFSVENDQPLVRLKSGAAVAAHTEAACSMTFGQLEPWVGRSTSSTAKAEFGNTIEAGGIYWLPGSIVANGQSFQLSRRSAAASDFQPKDVWQPIC